MVTSFFNYFLFSIIYNIMYKYLFLILLGIILFLYNNVEGFSIGGQISVKDIITKDESINIDLKLPFGNLNEEQRNNIGTRIYYKNDTDLHFENSFSFYTDSEYYVYSLNNEFYLVELNNDISKQNLYPIYIFQLNIFFQLSPPPPTPPPTPTPTPTPISPPQSELSCPTIDSTRYTNSVLDWSTDDNPYGRPMYDTSKSYIEQGICGTCIVYSIVSQLSCLYNIQLYENIDNCKNFRPIMISPRSILDILMRYKKFSYTTPNISNIYNYNTDCSNYLNYRCGFTFLRDYDFISIYNSIKNLKESLKYLSMNPHFYGHNFIVNMNNNITENNFKYHFHLLEIIQLAMKLYMKTFFNVLDLINIYLMIEIVQIQQIKIIIILIYSIIMI